MNMFIIVIIVITINIDFKLFYC